jgi:hypothetical protein
LKCSEEFPSKDLLSLFYNAIMCGLASASLYGKQNIRHLEIGENIDGGALKMTKDDYEWGCLRARIGSSIPGGTSQRINSNAPPV